MTHSTTVSRVAVLQIVLILPAATFMSAVIARYLPAIRQPAQHIVMMYAGHMWTLWILLLALPLCVLFAGSITLLRERTLDGGRTDARQSQAAPRRAPAARFVAATTVTAAGILAVVVLHMLAN